MNVARRVLLAATAMLVAACSVLPRIEVYNLTGTPIILRIEAEAFDRRQTFDELVTIAPGHDRRFLAGRVRGDRLPIKVGRCTYVYWLGDIPDEMYDHFGDTIGYELRPDLTLHLHRYEGEGTDLSYGKKWGFPRRALSRSCA